MKQAPPEDGPPMFWYGWVVLSGAAAAVAGLDRHHGSARNGSTG